MSEEDIQGAFRDGLRGQPFAAIDAAGLEEAPAAFLRGPNEALMLGLRRLPGLRDARDAYETGRALRAILRLFDQAKAPQSVGQQFVDNLGAAVVTHRMRGTGRPWSGGDTVEMFIEMYRCIFGEQGSDFEPVREGLLATVREGPSPARRESGPLGFLRRRQAAAAG